MGGPLGWGFATSKFVVGPILFGAMTYGALKLKNPDAHRILGLVVKVETVIAALSPAWYFVQLAIGFFAWEERN